MKKQTLLLGTLGAAAAIGTCAITHVIPVQAQESESVTISVTVKANAPSVTLSGIKDGTIFTTSKFDGLAVNYNYAEKLVYKLSHYDAAGRQTDFTISEKDMLSGGFATNGSDKFSLDLNNFGGEFGRYVLKAINQGSGVAEDSLTFRYAPIANPKGVDVDDAGNPVVEADISEETEYVIIKFMDGDNVKYMGKILTPDTKVRVNLLDVAEEIEGGVEDGTYRIVLVPYGKDNKRQSTETVEYGVTFANVVKVPETGSAKNTLSELGLSDTDIIAVCCVLFAAATVGGVAALTKTRRHNRR